MLSVSLANLFMFFLSGKYEGKTGEGEELLIYVWKLGQRKRFAGRRKDLSIISGNTREICPLFGLVFHRQLQRPFSRLKDGGVAKMLKAESGQKNLLGENQTANNREKERQRRYRTQDVNGSQVNKEDKFLYGLTAATPAELWGRGSQFVVISSAVPPTAPFICTSECEEVFFISPLKRSRLMPGCHFFTWWLLSAKSPSLDFRQLGLISTSFDSVWKIAFIGTEWRTAVESKQLLYTVINEYQEHSTNEYQEHSYIWLPGTQ